MDEPSDVALRCIHVQRRHLKAATVHSRSASDSKAWFNQRGRQTAGVVQGWMEGRRGSRMEGWQAWFKVGGMAGVAGLVDVGGAERHG